jgi:cellulose synthase/poly-beta-1,6-N-acetylglucosamine synthase-like glycosyltransferase
MNVKVNQGTTISVCCHNSAARIKPTIEHLARQVTDRPWEVVLVDNACVDGTVELARRTWAESGAPTQLRVVDEQRLGLAFARERGISQAQYEYVVLCDDDNWLDAQYIQQAAEIMEARPDIGALGGICKPTSDEEFPAWFWTYAHGYAVGAQALESGDITEGRLVWGAGMVLRRSAYRLVRAEGMRTLLTDRRGAELTTGGDGEICKWLVLAGYRLWYDERLKLTHFIPAERLTKEYCRRLRTGAAEAGRLMKHYHLVIDATRSNTLKRLIQLFGGVVKMCRGDRFGRSIIQAYNPVPLLVVDRTTREIQVIAKRIRNFAPPPINEL